MINKQTPIKCPNCQSELFQQFPLGTLTINHQLSPIPSASPNFKFQISNTIYICANCSYQIENIDDLNPREIVLHITGNSESRKRRSILDAGFKEKDYENWKSDLLCLNNHWFITRKDYEEKRVPISAPAGCLIKTMNESS